MSREAWGYPPTPEPARCPLCGNDHHSDGCEVCELDKTRIALTDQVKALEGQRGTLRILLKEAGAVLSTIEPKDTHEAGLLAQLRTDIAKVLA